MARGKSLAGTKAPEDRLKQALVSKKEQPFVIPSNWAWIHLGSVSTNQYGYTAKALYSEKLPKMLRITDIQENGVDWENVPNCEISKDDIDKYLLEENDIVIARIGATTGKSFLIKEPPCAVFASYLIRLRFTNYLLPQYVYLYLQSDAYWKQISELSSGIALPGVNSSKLQTLMFPAAPVAEQKRIVDRIESIFAKLDEAKEKAQAVVDGYELRKSAILYSAFSGELTKQWREDHSPAKEDFAKEARNKRDEAIRKNRAKQLKYSMPDDVALFDIPDSWQFLQMGDIAWSIKDGPHFSPEYVEDGIPFITGGNVRPNGVDFDSAKRITPELHAELCKRCRPEKNDMLYTKGGTTGIARVNTYDIEFSVWVHVAVIKFVDTVLPQYFQYVLNSPYCYEQSQKYTHGVGNQDLGLTRMINILFPVCSIAEQKEIISILDDLLEKEEQVKSAAEAVVEQIDTMKKAVLARAFRGELGTNDPTEASAIELLKSII